MKNKIVFKLLFSVLFCFLMSPLAFASPPPDPVDEGTEVVQDAPAPEVKPEDDTTDLLPDLENKEKLHETDVENFDSGISILEKSARTSAPCEGIPDVVKLRTNNNKGYHKYECQEVETQAAADALNADACQCAHVATIRDAGCFDGETMILMGDKSQKAVRELRMGDMVWNPVLKRAQMVKHFMAGPEKLPLIEVGLADSTLKITQTHPVVVRRAQGGFGTQSGFRTIALQEGAANESVVIKANELRENDLVLGADNAFHQIKSLRELPVKQGQKVYNFELAADDDSAASHMVVANGVASPDVRIQAKLNGDTLPWDK